MTSFPSTELAAARVRAAVLRLQLIEAKAGFREDQPHTPAGNHEQSGRWIGGAGSGGGGTRNPIEQGIGNIQRGIETGLKHVRDGVAAAGKNAADGFHAFVDQAPGDLKPLGGELNKAGQAIWSNVPAPIRNEINAAISDATPSVAAFLDGNREAIASTLGSLQAIGGLAQGVEGTDLIMVGMSSAPEGLPLVAIGGWMTARGYDDWDTGLRTLVSGAPQDGGFYTALRGFGLSDTEAQVALAAAAGLPGAAINRLSRKALEAAADRALIHEAAETLEPTLIVHAIDGSSIFDKASIYDRGTAFEAAYANLTGAKLLPPGTRTFDAVSADGEVVISNKTLDLDRDFYKTDKPEVVRLRMKRMIDQVADFKPDAQTMRAFDFTKVEERRLALLIPAGRARPGQIPQLAAAARYQVAGSRASHPAWTMSGLPPTMGATVWLRKGKVLITGAVYLWPHLTQERDLTSASPLIRWSDLCDVELGRLLKERLESTRCVSSFPDQVDVREEVREFTQQLAALFGLKSSHNLFSGMKQINVFRTPPYRFDFHPNKNRGRGFFQEFSNLWPDKQPFGIAFYASDAEIGAATRLGMGKSI